MVSAGVLIAYGVRSDGYRETLDVRVADTESRATYEELFADLKARGLSGVVLVTSDAHEGLKAAVARHFQGASWQRCLVHFTRDLTEKIAFARCKEFVADLREVFAASDRAAAPTVAARIADKWRPTHPKVAGAIDEHIEECLTALAFPAAHRRRF
ncbi:MAG: transposase [Actinobacteria bacterium]|nr:transposase [Actinomycetota bacterium]